MFLYDKNCPVKKICINKDRDRHLGPVAQRADKLSSG